MVAENVVVMSEYRSRLQPPARALLEFGPDEPAPVTPKSFASRWISRLAPVFMLPMAREIQAFASRHVLEDGDASSDPRFDAGGSPVLLIGGLASTPGQLKPLRDWLIRGNCRADICPIAYGVGCGERTTAMVTESLVALAARTGRRCVLIAHSRGGQFARAAAVRNPELVEALVTLGSPMNRMLGIHPLLKAEVVMLGLAGSVGIPGLLRTTCMWGDCCRALRADLLAPFPEEVEFVSVYSRQDRIVDWRSSLDPAASHREIDTTHSGLLCSAAAIRVLADELSRIFGRPASTADPVLAI